MILTICEVPEVLKVLRIVNIVITLIRIVVPIILIIAAMIEYTGAVANPTDLTKTHNMVLKKVIAAVIIFFIPTFVNIIFDITDPNGKTYISCLNDATTERIKALYQDNMDKRIKTLEDNLKKEEYAASNDAYIQALNYLKNIDDKELKQSYTNKLEDAKTKIAAIKEKLDEEERKRIEEEIEKNKPKIVSEGLSPEEFERLMQTMETPTMVQLKAAAKAPENNIDDDYFIIVVGSTFNEAYYNDPYLYYGWASAMINKRYSYSTLLGWDPYSNHCSWFYGNIYSLECMQESYNHVNDTTKKAIYLALTHKNTKIEACNGTKYMNSNNYNIIYDSKVYNCKIGERKY